LDWETVVEFELAGRVERREFFEVLARAFEEGVARSYTEGGLHAEDLCAVWRDVEGRFDVEFRSSADGHHYECTVTPRSGSVQVVRVRGGGILRVLLSDPAFRRAALGGEVRVEL